MEYRLIHDKNYRFYSKPIVQQLVRLFGQQPVGQIVPQPVEQFAKQPVSLIRQQLIAKIMPIAPPRELQSSLPSIKEIEKELGSKK